MSPPPGIRTRNRFPQHRRLEVFEATVHLVITHGYEETTMEAIATATATSKATLYRQWQTKAQLVAEAVKHLSGIEIAAIDTGSLIGDLTELMRMLALRAEQNVPLSLGLAGASQRHPALRDVLTSYTLPELTALRSIFERALARGEIDQATTALPYIQHLMVGAVLTPALLNGPESVVDFPYLESYLHSVILPVFGITDAHRTND